MILPLITGMLAGSGLLTLYAVTMTVLGGWGATVEQFRALWYLMLPLAAGFGIQVILYTKLLARGAPIKSGRPRASMATGGTSASVSMLACCTHHATDVLPFLGLSGASIFLTRWQIPLLLISLVINVLGTLFMLTHLRKLANLQNRAVV